MFENLENNKKMILGAYKKLKSYYYYDKTILFNKVRLSIWESNTSFMEESIHKLAEFMCSLEADIDYKYLSPLMRSISLVPVPKAFKEEEKNGAGTLIQNVVPKNRPITKVNFYIKAPVELLILDLIWMLMVGKIAYQQNAISTAAYANKPKIKQLYTDDNDLFYGIDFESNRLFIPYFKQYTAWRDSALKQVQSRYKEKKDSILITLDIKSYYYSLVFCFDNLPKYLNEDARLKAIAPLTQIIKQVYIDYTSEMQKYRGAIPADCKKGQCALPIGLHSSMLIANLYLNELDIAIQSKISPAYYGRYVDDILIVIDRPSDAEMSVTSILYESLVKNGIIKPKGEKEYSIITPDIAPHYLTLQSEKIRCIYFDHNEPDALIKRLCEACNIKASMDEGALMPDIGLSKRSFDEHAYSLGERSGSLKVRDFLFSSNNYEATMFINNLIRISKNVDIHESRHKEYINEQLDQILKFYHASKGIEYRSAWINVFALILANEGYDSFVKFFLQLKQAIDSLPIETIELIETIKTEIVITNIKNALFEQLKVAASIAIAPFSLAVVKNKINESLKADGQHNLDLQEIFDNAKDIRKANMFNNHFSAFPLVSYIQGSDDDCTSLADMPLDKIKELVNQNNTDSPLEYRKVQFCPRFIHFDELCLLSFLTHYFSGGNPICGNIEPIIQYFSTINSLKKSIPTMESSSKVGTGINLHRISVTSSHRDLSNRKMKVALASIWLDEETDIEPVLQHPVHDLLPKKKQEFYRLLNEAKINHADMIIFPEYYLPIQWIEEVYTFSRLNSIAVVCGLRYIKDEYRAYNYMTIIQPFKNGWFKYALPLFREKNHYAPAEKSALAKHQCACEDPSNPSIHLIDWNGAKYSDLMCYELTNIEYRYILRGKIDILLIPELNKDTTYFSNIVESASRDLHCFVIQANTSKYGDSRVTGPYKSLVKDIIKIKGGENNVLLIGTINFGELQDKRNQYPTELKNEIKEAWNGKKLPAEKKQRLKDPPAGFYGKKGGAQ